jgi:hypothetical protein
VGHHDEDGSRAWSEDDEQSATSPGDASSSVESHVFVQLSLIMKLITLLGRDSGSTLRILLS